MRDYSYIYYIAKLLTMYYNSNKISGSTVLSPYFLQIKIRCTAENQKEKFSEKYTMQAGRPASYRVYTV